MVAPMPLAFLVVLSVFSCSTCILVFSAPDLFDDVFHDSASHSHSWIAKCIGIGAVLIAITSPVWGALSDIHGRHQVLTIAAMLHTSIIILLAFLPSKYTFQGMFLLAATLNIIYALGYAMMSDLTKSKQLTPAFGLVNASFGVGITFGLVLGHLLSDFRSKVPYFVSSIANMACLIITHVYVDETHMRDAVQNSIWTKLTQFSWRRTQFLIMALILGSMHFTDAIHGAMYFYTNYRFGWQLHQHLNFVSLQGFVFVASLTIALRSSTLRWSIRQILLASILCQAFSFAFTAATTQGWQIYIIFCVGGLHSIGAPALRAYLSGMHCTSNQGTLQGILSAVSTISMIIGDPCFKYLIRISISENLKRDYPHTCPPGYHGALDQSQVNCGGLPSLVFAFATLVLLIVFAIGLYSIHPPKKRTLVSLVVAESNTCYASDGSDVYLLT